MGDTITAAATAAGKSAIGILRLSGDRAIEIAERVFLHGLICIFSVISGKANA